MTERERIAERWQQWRNSVGFNPDIADFILAEISAAEQRGAEAMREKIANKLRLRSIMAADPYHRADWTISAATALAWAESDVRALAVPAPATDAGEKETA